MRISIRSWAAAATAFIALASPPAIAETKAEEGVRFQPPDHEFSVNLPTTPVHSVRTTETVIGDIDTDIWATTFEGGDYSIAITDLPSVALWFNDAEDLIEKARTEMLETLGAKQADLRNLKQGHFSEQLDYVIPAQADKPAQRGRAWFALIDDKLVVVSAQVPQASASVLDRHFSLIDTGADALARR